MAEVQGKPSASSEGIFGGISVENDRFLSGSETAPNEPQPNVTMYIPEASLDVRSKLSLKCPACGCEGTFYRDGLRYATDGSSIQRWLCRACGLRFSEKPLQKTSEQPLNTSFALPSNCQICATNKEAKNLELAQKTNICARDEKLPPNAAGLVAQFLAYLEKEGFCGESQYPGLIKRLAKLGANLQDPEDVKAVIGRQKVKDGMKLQYVYAYNAFAIMLKIAWVPPKYRQEETIPFIPDEPELDALITACRTKTMAAYLQCLKETYGDPTEALRIEWIDVSEKEQTIKINHPVKGHLPRTLKVSNKLLSMLNCLPKTSTRVFTCTYRSVSCAFTRLRKRTAEFQKNPRLLSIQLRTFRHWGGTMIAYHTNGNVLIVKKLLGHKRVENSMKYIGMIDFKEDEFETTTATTPEEIKKLGQAGWIKYDEITINGAQMHFYKKPKRFSKYA